MTSRIPIPSNHPSLIGRSCFDWTCSESPAYLATKVCSLIRLVRCARAHLSQPTNQPLSTRGRSPATRVSRSTAPPPPRSGVRGHRHSQSDPSSDSSSLMPFSRSSCLFSIQHRPDAVGPSPSGALARNTRQPMSPLASTVLPLANLQLPTPILRLARRARQYTLSMPFLR